nr:GspE/PulE family protein [Planctomycetota bacterium]
LMGQEEVQIVTGCLVEPRAAPLSLLDELLHGLFGARDIVAEIAGEDEEGEEGEDALTEADLVPDEEQEEIVDLERPVAPGKDGQIIRIVNLLLANAIRGSASDIHLEPYEESVRVRYRVDGKMAEVTPPPRALFLPVISRLKVLSKMDIAERRIPQDGAISARLADVRIDFRVSTVPTVYGEKMVLRILAKEATPDCLTKLGFSEKQAQAFEDAANAPHGLMFVTGPTGSGKSTTLYTCLNLINRPTHNIVTVEDPVEYRFDGLNQSQVHSEVGMTFSKALRAFLRQDPDVIMLGEVRDQETADICLRAALTGHLVLSTLHTNDSLQAINRLVDMGIEPFLLGPALRLVQAQRLARKLCPECRVAYDVTADVADLYGIEPGTTLYRSGPGSCERCRGVGYKGRVGIFEVIAVNEAMAEMIMKAAPLSELYRVGKENGFEFLCDNARAKVLDGATSIEEVADYLRPAEAA